MPRNDPQAAEATKRAEAERKTAVEGRKIVEIWNAVRPAGEGLHREHTALDGRSGDGAGHGFAPVACRGVASDCFSSPQTLPIGTAAWRLG
jgi:hypothetical protein